MYSSNLYFEALFKHSRPGIRLPSKKCGNYIIIFHVGLASTSPAYILLQQSPYYSILSYLSPLFSIKARQFRYFTLPAGIDNIILNNSSSCFLFTIPYCVLHRNRNIPSLGSLVSSLPNSSYSNSAQLDCYTSLRHSFSTPPINVIRLVFETISA